jgi:hypothetical protein
MTGKKTAAKAEPKTVVADDPADRTGRLKNIGGSQSDHWNNILANQAVQALWLKNSSPEERDKQLSATVAALIGIAPKGTSSARRSQTYNQTINQTIHRPRETREIFQCSLKCSTRDYPKI